MMVVVVFVCCVCEVVGVVEGEFWLVCSGMYYSHRTARVNIILTYTHTYTAMSLIDPGSSSKEPSGKERFLDFLQEVKIELVGAKEEFEVRGLLLGVCVLLIYLFISLFIYFVGGLRGVGGKEEFEVRTLGCVGLEGVGGG